MSGLWWVAFSFLYIPKHECPALLVSLQWCVETQRTQNAHLGSTYCVSKLPRAMRDRKGVLATHREQVENGNFKISCFQETWSFCFVFDRKKKNTLNQVSPHGMLLEGMEWGWLSEHLKWWVCPLSLRSSPHFLGWGWPSPSNPPINSLSSGSCFSVDQPSQSCSLPGMKDALGNKDAQVKPAQFLRAWKQLHSPSVPFQSPYFKQAPLLVCHLPSEMLSWHLSFCPLLPVVCHGIYTLVVWL